MTSLIGRAAVDAESDLLSSRIHERRVNIVHRVGRLSIDRKNVIARLHGHTDLRKRGSDRAVPVLPGEDLRDLVEFRPGVTFQLRAKESQRDALGTGIVTTADICVTD